MTQSALARAAGTSQPAVARYESGRIDPGVETLSRLVAACGMRLALGVEKALPGPVGDVLERARAEVLDLCAEHGAHRVRVFGSVARGEDRPDSDVDLLVDLKPGRTLLDLERLQVALTDLLGVTVDVATERILRDGVSEQALAQSRAL